MGPHLHLADVGRRIGVAFGASPPGTRQDQSALPTSSSRMPPLGGFHDYLEGARSLREAAQHERPEVSNQPEETSEEGADNAPANDQQAQTAESTPDAVVGALMAEAAQGGETPVEQHSAVPASTEDAIRPGSEVEDQGLGVRGRGRGDGTQLVIQKDGASIESTFKKLALASGPRGLKSAASPVAEVASKAGAKQPPRPVGSADVQAEQNGEAGPKKGSLDGVKGKIVEQPTARQEQSGGTRTDSRSDLGSGAAKASGEMSTVAAKPDGRSSDMRLTPDHETIHDLKVKDSIEQRRQGSAGARGEQSQAGDQGSRPRLSGPVADGVEGLELAQSKEARTDRNTGLTQAGSMVGSLGRGLLEASVIRVSGDSAAASVARFMLADAKGSGGLEGHAVHNVEPGQARSVAGGADSALANSVVSRSVGSMVGEAMAAELTGPDGLANAARVLRASSGPGRFQVTMQLNPPELGQLKLQIQMHQQTMTLQVDAQTREAARLIESRWSELRDTLSMHGIRVDRADVVVRSPTAGDAGLQQQDGGQNGGGETGHRAGERSGAGGFEDGNAAGDQRNETWEGTGVEPAAKVDEAGAAQATELILDLVA